MKLILILITVMFCSNTMADDFFVETPTLVNTPESMKEVVRELMVQALEEKKHSILSNPAKAKYVLTASIMKLEASYVVTIKKRDGQNIVSKKMKTQTLDDLDVTIARLTSAVLGDHTTNDPIKVEEVTNNDIEKRKRKIQTERQWTFGFGPAFLQNMDLKNAVSVTFGYMWALTPTFDLTLRYSFSNAEGESSAGLMFLDMGGHFFFSDSVNAPYLLATFGYGNAETNLENDNGWAVSAGGGVMFFRAHNINLGVELKYTTVFTKVHEANGKEGTPSQLACNLLIYF